MCGQANMIDQPLPVVNRSTLKKNKEWIVDGIDLSLHAQISKACDADD
jgi:hypothetical protein